MFWLLICAWWLAIKGLLVVPIFCYLLTIIFCYLLTIIFCVFGTVELLLALRLVVTQITESSQNVLKHCSNLVLFQQDNFANTSEMRRPMTKKYVVRKLCSLKPIQFYYFSNFRIDRGFQTDVFKNMVDRLFDALMIL